jgi:ATP-binding cassette subfamily B protein
MNTAELSLKKFFWRVIKPYPFYLMGLFLTGVWWGINNALSPYVLKLIIDKIALLESNRSSVLEALKPEIIFYCLLWVVSAFNFRLMDWLRLKLFPRLRFDITKKLYAYLNQHSHRYFQNNFAGSLANKISDMREGTIRIFSLMDDATAQVIGLAIAMASMLLIHPVFAVVLFVWTTWFLLIVGFYFKKIQHLSNVFATSQTTLVGKMVDSISNLINLRLFSRRPMKIN